MMRMVRAGGSPPMLVVGRENGMTECVFIDGAGVIRHRTHPDGSIVPLWLSLSPRTTWPETSQLDLIAIENEERVAAEDRRKSRRAARKAKRSNKIKGRKHAAA